MEQPDSKNSPVPVSRSALAILYVAFLVVKPVYFVIVAVVPYFVRWYVNLWKELAGMPLGDFSVSWRWLAGFGVLTVLTAFLAVRYAIEAGQAARETKRTEAARLVLRKLVLAWTLLDSISFYGVVSKVLRYPDVWCYGFVAVSTALTVAAGWPLLALWREDRP